MKNYFTLLLLVAIGISCTKNDDDSGTPEPESFLENLHIGDKLYYTLLSGYNYYDPDQNEYAYMGDTLELEVVSKSATGVEITQRITPGSTMMHSLVEYYWHKDSVYTNTWKIEGDSLFFGSGAQVDQTHLLYTTPLKFSDYTEEKVELTGWRTTYNYSESNAQLYTTDYTLFGHYYDSLSVYIHNEPMSYDANGTTVVFSKAHGIVRTSEYGWWSQSGFGWDRIY